MKTYLFSFHDIPQRLFCSTIIFTIIPPMLNSNGAVYYKEVYSLQDIAKGDLSCEIFKKWFVQKQIWEAVKKNVILLNLDKFQGP